MSKTSESDDYNLSDLRIINTIAKNYMRYGEFAKARQLFEASCEITQGEDHSTLKYLAYSAYHEGNSEAFENAVRKFTRKNTADPEVKQIISLYMFLSGNEKCYAFFNSIDK